MSEEIKTEQVAENTESQYISGPRGELGTSTAGLTIKQMWHEAHFNLVNVHSKKNPHKQAWVRKLLAPSLKAFAHQLAKSGNPTAEEWLGNKHGAKNEKRSDANAKAAVEASMASRTARRKSGSGGKK